MPVGIAIEEDIVKRLRLGEKNVLSGSGGLCFQMKLRKALWLKQRLYIKTRSGMTERTGSSLVNVSPWDVGWPSAARGGWGLRRCLRSHEQALEAEHPGTFNQTSLPRDFYDGRHPSSFASKSDRWERANVVSGDSC